jgi:hypothetical protein
MNFNVAFLLLTLTIVGVYSHCPNQGKIIIFTHYVKVFLYYHFGAQSTQLCHIYIFINQINILQRTVNDLIKPVFFLSLSVSVSLCLCLSFSFSLSLVSLSVLFQ